MHSRFDAARSVTVFAPGGQAIAYLAESFGLRFLGLMRVPAEDVEPLLFPRCRSLHMYWMRTPIDVVWLDLDLDAGRARVLGIVENLPKRHGATAPKAADSGQRSRIAALELAPGEAARLRFSDGLDISLSVESPPRG